MRQLQRHLTAKGDKSLFLSLDFERDQSFFTSQAALLEKIRVELGTDKGFVFIDEIQRKENAGLFLKGLYDYDTPYKFIVSVSGSLELKESVHESLAGRKRIFPVDTLSLHEFLQFRTEYRYEDRLEEYFQVNPEEGQRLLLEYLNYGGYPRVVLEDTLEEKLRIIDEIYRSYIEKDIAYLLRVERIEAFGNLIRLLADQTGRMINVTELSSSLGISLPTVKNYLAYAEKTFIIRLVTPFFRNLRKEISKAPVVYFHDLGLRNFALRRFGHHTTFQETGFLFQNLVHQLLQDRMRHEASTLHHWRTKDKAEVDFVIDRAQEVIPVEVKSKELKNLEIGRSMRAFLAKYRPAEAWVINLRLRDEETIGETKVRFLPWFAMLHSLSVTH
jgi:hypothetical protein